MARQSTFHVRSGVWLLPHKRHSSGGHPCHPRIQVAMCDVPFAGLPGIDSTPGRWWIPRSRPMPQTHTTSQLGPSRDPSHPGCGYVRKTPFEAHCAVVRLSPPAGKAFPKEMKMKIIRTHTYTRRLRSLKPAVGAGVAGLTTRKVRVGIFLGN